MPSWSAGSTSISPQRSCSSVTVANLASLVEEEARNESESRRRLPQNFPFRVWIVHRGYCHLIQDRIGCNETCPELPSRSKTSIETTRTSFWYEWELRRVLVRYCIHVRYMYLTCFVHALSHHLPLRVVIPKYSSTAIRRLIRGSPLVPGSPSSRKDRLICSFLPPQAESISCSRPTCY